MAYIRDSLSGERLRILSRYHLLLITTLESLLSNTMISIPLLRLHSGLEGNHIRVVLDANIFVDLLAVFEVSSPCFRGLPSNICRISYSLSV